MIETVKKETRKVFNIPFFHTGTGCLSPDLPLATRMKNLMLYETIYVQITASSKKEAQGTASGIEKKCTHCREGRYTRTGK